MAYAASRWVTGTVLRTSRETDETIGTSMIARIMPPASSPIPYGGPLNSGSQPSVLPSAGSTALRSHGAITKMPQRPRITLGMEASSSTTKDRTVETPAGAISAR